MHAHFVLGLRPVDLAAHTDPSGDVFHAHRSLNLVHVLAACKEKAISLVGSDRGKRGVRSERICVRG